MKKKREIWHWILIILLLPIVILGFLYALTVERFKLGVEIFVEMFP